MTREEDIRHVLMVGVDQDYKVTVALPSGEAFVMPWSDAVRLGATVLTMSMYAAQALDNDEETFTAFLIGARDAAMAAMEHPG